MLTYVLVLLVLSLRVGVSEAEREGVHVRRLLLVHGPRVNRLQQRRGKISGHFPIKNTTKQQRVLAQRQALRYFTKTSGVSDKDSMIRFQAMLK